ncbi:hypothetical protein HDU88_008941 [Geranomyces variabilis]|nr:hypothetical protein HDU88_008941 [Geranomyces variabilis]
MCSPPTWTAGSNQPVFPDFTIYAEANRPWEVYKTAVYAFIADLKSGSISKSNPDQLVKELKNSLKKKMKYAEAGDRERACADGPRL